MNGFDLKFLFLKLESIPLILRDCIYKSMCLATLGSGTILLPPCMRFGGRG